MVFVLLNLLLEIIHGDLLIFDGNVDLELINGVGQGDSLGGTPDETVHLNGTDVSLELIKVGLIILKCPLAGVNNETYS